jgi:hypothetical protein
MSSFEDFMNRLTDIDLGWWPFLFLRPKKDQLIDTAALLNISIYFGVLYGAVFYCVWAILKRTGFSIASLLAHIVVFPIAFFVLYKCTFAVFWNRRARRLQSQRPGPSAT